MHWHRHDNYWLLWYGFDLILIEFQLVFHWIAQNTHLTFFLNIFFLQKRSKLRAKSQWRINTLKNAHFSKKKMCVFFNRVYFTFYRPKNDRLSCMNFTIPFFVLTNTNHLVISHCRRHQINLEISNWALIFNDFFTSFFFYWRIFVFFSFFSPLLCIFPRQCSFSPKNTMQSSVSWNV